MFGRTLREAPGDVELPSHQLMLRAAFMRPLGAGIYSLLPIGWRVVRKVVNISSTSGVNGNVIRVCGQSLIGA